MKIHSSPFLSKLTCVALAAFFLIVWFQLYRLHTLTIENMFVLAFLFLMSFFLLLYMDSHYIEFRNDSISYIGFGEKKILPYQAIHKIEINYYHQRIRTIAPVLHIIGEAGEIEIPFGLFEKKFDKIHQMIQQKVSEKHP